MGVAAQRLETTIDPVESWDGDDVEAWLRSIGSRDEVVGGFRSGEVSGANMLGLDQGTLFGLVKKVGTAQSLLRQIQGLKAPSGPASPGPSAAVAPSPPQDFYCPITYEVMGDPVVAADGFTYERSAIEHWLQNNDRSSPMTNAPLQHRRLVPNQVLKNLITAFFDKYPLPKPPID